MYKRFDEDLQRKPFGNVVSRTEYSENEENETKAKLLTDETDFMTKIRLFL